MRSSTPSAYTNFTAVVSAIKAFHDQHSDIEIDAYLEENLRLVQFLCTRVDDAYGTSFYTPDELAVLVKAHQVVKSRHGHPVSIENLKAAAAGLKIRTSHDKYLEVINELNGTNAKGKSLFQALREATTLPEQRSNIDRIETAWSKRTAFANLTSEALDEVAYKIHRIEAYLTILNNEFYSTQHRPDEITSFTELMAESRATIAHERGKLIQAMLSRLALVPIEHLSYLQMHSNGPDPEIALLDDVVLQSMHELLPFGLATGYFNDVAKKSPPHHTLTYRLIREFNSYIRTYGDDAQKAAHEQMYSEATKLTIKNLAAIQLTASFEIVTMPSRVIGHDHIIFRDNTATSDVNLTSSIILMRSGTVFQSSDQIMKTFYAILKEDKADANPTPVGKDEISEFEYVLSQKEYECAHGYMQHFSLGENQELFLQKLVTLLLKREQPAATIDDVCKQARDQAAMHISETYLAAHYANDTTLTTDEKETKKREFKQIASKQYALFIQNTSAEKSFEHDVLDTSVQIQQTIDTAANALPSHLQDMQLFFVHQCYAYLHDGANNVNNAIDLATQNITTQQATFNLYEFIDANRPATIADKDYSNFKDIVFNKVKENPHWQTDMASWVLGLNYADTFMQLKHELHILLSNEDQRINKQHCFSFFTSSNKTRQKLSAIQRGIQAVDNAHGIDDIKQITNTLLSDAQFTQNRSIFSFFSPIHFDSTTKVHLSKFKTQHRLGS